MVWLSQTNVKKWNSDMKMVYYVCTVITASVCLIINVAAHFKVTCVLVGGGLSKKMNEELT